MSTETRRRAKYSALVGSDGWLFIDDIDKMFEKHTGKVTLSPEQLYHWQLTLELRDRWIEGRGSHYYFMVAPSKASIYGRFLPSGYAESPRKPLFLLKVQLDTHSFFRIIDPTERLVALSKERQIYYQTDEHWNHFGAYCVYRQLLGRINQDVPVTELAESRLETHERAFIGELSAVLPAPYRERALFAKVCDPAASIIYENKPAGRGKVQISENRDALLPRAVMFRDSFANALLPMLAESFSRLVSVSSRFVHFDLIESEQPDVVITELAERYLDPAPDDIRCPSFDSYCGVSLPQIREMHLPRS